MKSIVVVGAGPAGMMAAIRASQLGQAVTLIEKNPVLGKKLLLSGKGRCNLTNFCELEPFIKRFSKNGQFLRDAFKKFFNRELIGFFEKRGLRLKVERQLRVFPVTDRAGSVVGVLAEELRANKVNILYKSRLKDILVQGNRVKGLLFLDNRSIPCDKLILATGGASYGFTGSTGEGLEIAARLGHSIVPLRPGLAPLETRQKYPRALAGLTLKNIRIKFAARPLRAGAGFSDGQREAASDIGELLFTAYGISGPLVLALSGKVADWLKQGNDVSAQIDLKPALSKEQLDARLLREFKLNAKKSVRHALKGLLPLKLVGVFLGIAGIDPRRKVSHLSRAERQTLVGLLKGLRLDIAKTRPIEEAMVSRGGVSLKDIDPRTMESRRIKGLYFAGEMIDVDADSGGFNLQAAFSTGYLAGESAALSTNSRQ